jgi:hypothetical protein
MYWSFRRSRVFPGWLSLGICATVAVGGCLGGGGSDGPAATVTVASSGASSSSLVAITAFAASAPGFVTVTSANSLVAGDVVVISGTVNFDGTYTVSNVTSSKFDIPFAPAFPVTETGYQQLAGGLIAGCVTTDVSPVGATGIILPVVSAPNYQGVAPLSVFFDATGTTAPTKTSKPFHELEYRWAFNDASGAWGTGTGTSRASATGPIAAHVFETPGVYTVSLRVTDGTNTVQNQCARIAVLSPDTVFAGNNTICFSSSGTFSDAPSGFCTAAGVTAITTSDFTTAIATYAATGKRLLFRRGETFTAAATATLAVNGPGIIGAYGALASKPLIQAVSPLNNLAAPNELGILNVSSATTPAISDWRVMDLKFDGSLSPSPRIVAVQLGGGISRLTLLRLTTNEMRVGIGAGSGLLDAFNGSVNPANHGHAIWDQLSVVDTRFENVHYGLVGDTSTWGYGSFISAERLFYAGNYIDSAGTATAGVSHNARFPYLGKAVITNNTLMRPGPTEHIIKLHAPLWGSTTVETAGIGSGYTRWVVISDNKFVGGNNAWSVGMGPQDGSRDERQRDLLVERNWFVAGPGTQYALKVWATEVTVRNNLFDTSGGSGHGAIAVETRGAGQEAPSQVRLFNNSIYSGDVANNFAAITLDATVSAVAISNNLAYAPSDTQRRMLSGAGAGFTASGNSCDTMNCTGRVNTDPNFTLPLSSTGAWKPNAASYASGGGTNVGVPVWSDFFLVASPPARNIGAMIP